MHVGSIIATLEKASPKGEGIQRKPILRKVNDGRPPTAERSCERRRHRNKLQQATRTSVDSS